MCVKNDVCKVYSDPNSSVVRELVKSFSDGHSIYTLKDKLY